MSPHGQGSETVFAQIVADMLGVDYDDVEVLHGDTATTPFGMDTYGSRGVAVGGVALHTATEKVIAKARTLAAHELECAEEDLEFADGTFTIKGTGRGVGIKSLAFSSWTAHNLPDGMEPGLQASHLYDPPNFSWPNGAHCCVVEVDQDTGLVEIVRYVAVDDCGVQLNPMLVEGQVHGGVAQGIAEALYEEAIYDERRQPHDRDDDELPGPRSARATAFEVHDRCTPSPTNPMGVKGIGEAGTIAAPPAVINAVVDALAHLGVRNVERPATPGAGMASDRGCEGGEGMIPASFDYEVAESVEHALELLGSADDPKLLAGGHSLLPLMRLRLARPATLIDLGRIDGLGRASPTAATHLAIGALMRHHVLEHDALVRRALPATRPRCIDGRRRQVRHRGTIGGSLVARRPGRRPACRRAHARRADRRARPGW